MAMVATLTGCNEKSKLANKVEGVWSGNPERVDDTTAAYSTVIKTFDFQVDDTGEGGTVVVTALIDVQNSVTGGAAAVQPIELSAAATASVTGSWQAVDDDEIVISLDAQSAQVNVDPDAVRLDYSNVTDESASETTSMRPAAAAIVGRQVNAVLTSNILTISNLDDIKVHNGTVMECEINDKDVTMRRQPGA